MRIKVKDLPYSRFDVKRLEEAINKFVEAEKNAQSVQDVLKARKEWFDVAEEYSTSGSIAYVRYTLDTRDEFYVKEH